MASRAATSPGGADVCAMPACSRCRRVRDADVFAMTVGTDRVSTGTYVLMSSYLRRGQPCPLPLKTLQERYDADWKSSVDLYEYQARDLFEQ